MADDYDDTARTEAVPLLGRREDESIPNLPPAPQKTRSPRTGVVLLSFVIFCLAFGASLAGVPIMRLLEDIICRHYYKDSEGQDGSIDEKLCKIDAIQSELAYIRGFLQTLEAIVGLIVALPYGILADRIGRRHVFWLAMIGSGLNLAWALIVFRFWRSIPIEAIFISPVFHAIGGGYNVISTVIFSMVSDITSPENRSSAFFLITLAGHMATPLGPAVSSYLMEIGSPWTPFIPCYIMSSIGMMALIFVPETLRIKKGAGITQGESTFVSSITTRLRVSVTETRDSLSMLMSPNITMILLTNLISMSTVLAVGPFFVQYVSKRFDWTLADAGYLLAARGIASILVLLIVLPGSSKLLLLRTSAARKDLLLARASALFLTIGFFLLSGPHIAIVVIGIIVGTLGDGLSPLCRSLITNFTDSQHTSRLYALIGIVEAIGALYCGPALAWFFDTGMRLGGSWVGLPYIWLALSGILVVIALLLVRP